jgi:hypothetical protein
VGKQEYILKKGSIAIISSSRVHGIENKEPLLESTWNRPCSNSLVCVKGISYSHCSTRCWDLMFLGPEERISRILWRIVQKQGKAPKCPDHLLISTLHSVFLWIYTGTTNRDTDFFLDHWFFSWFVRMSKKLSWKTWWDSGRILV